MCTETEVNYPISYGAISIESAYGASKYDRYCVSGLCDQSAEILRRKLLIKSEWIVYITYKKYISIWKLRLEIFGTIQIERNVKNYVNIVRQKEN